MTRSTKAGRIALKQGATIAATFLGLVLVTFLIGRVMPLDPVTAAVGPDVSQEIYDAVKEEMGLNKPLLIQLLDYIGQVLRGDFGVSFSTNQPVIRDIARVFPATVELAAAGVLIGTLIGVPLGVLAAVKRGTAIDGAVRVVTLVGHSAPVFWKGLILLVVFYAALDWANGPGRLSVYYEGVVPTRTGLIVIDAILAREWDVMRDALGHLALPAFSLGYGAAAYIGRMTRSFMLDQLRQEYVSVARVKGLSEFRVVFTEVLPNCAVQLVTTIALTFGLLLEGAVLTETVFAWPGLGQYMTKAMFNADMNAVLGGTLVIGVIFVALNLGSDLLYRILDPRTRT
ncbi:peptide ABC transporter permease [Primorskyibacter flagellatus]|uniref:Peptide ABC transporter permease n=1 Tax=Primorskyibacter flagellatus TaxID=1387277 RepID=A0A917EJP9_9RHOB|nr:ABC transporter permease [Primorskyibacter flagellatus]GGE50228.1 peptide ABC transporter permease [Primorskyibacter flagellatus]